jgi:hypothetical protein
VVVGVGEDGPAFLQEASHQVRPPEVVALLLETRVPEGNSLRSPSQRM